MAKYKIFRLSANKGADLHDEPPILVQTILGPILGVHTHYVGCFLGSPAQHNPLRALPTCRSGILDIVRSTARFLPRPGCEKDLEIRLQYPQYGTAVFRFAGKVIRLACPFSPPPPPLRLFYPRCQRAPPRRTSQFAAHTSFPPLRPPSRAETRCLLQRLTAGYPLPRSTRGNLMLCPGVWERCVRFFLPSIRSFSDSLSRFPSPFPLACSDFFTQARWYIRDQI
ncbi:hypothetical protein C8R47DRAFT_657820 [Mycena vitilis]|nr:hypothetical protein C8R47DRAFT_657820 [Mycena vitilis]